MLLIDDILMSPYKGLLWVFEEIHKSAVEDIEGEAERIRNELTDLYMMLETEQIDEDEFDLRETALLDRLDRIEAQAEADAAAGDDEADSGLDDAPEEAEPATACTLLEPDAQSRDAERKRRELDVEDAAIRD
ncbi:MAG: gas vesicle protein GvpG [Thiohalocapsa sp.]|nr:gas vesicle protein GvpG [Thiohalocapsa sp.]MCF7990502.1 gas vesicle protein GvpG [Thiohalocapsa sp.]